MLVAVLVAVILTPGTAAPEGSVTLPVIAPVVVCPTHTDTSAKQIANHFVFRIGYPPFVTNLKQDTRTSPLVPTGDVRVSCFRFVTKGGYPMRNTKWLAICLALVSVCVGQTTTGAITGSVTDPSGAAVPGVKITATSTATNITNTTQSNEAGVYNFPFLPIGDYTVT